MATQLKLILGTRNSKLALAQVVIVQKEFQRRFPEIEISVVEFSSPGDRDRKADLRDSDPDFFTRDLDEAVVNGKIDCALHSAKDLPEPVSAGLDWFWLPWREDPSDVLIGNAECSGRKLRIGVSSARREQYCRKRFPDAEILPVRGNIDNRIAQLDEEKYDLLVMAAAGLNRLGLGNRITEHLPLDELNPPDGQGVLALTFKQGDLRFLEIRKLFVNSVVIAGAGAGSAGNITVATVEALRRCEICLYDCLIPEGVLKYISDSARQINVGKRSGSVSVPQHETCRMLADYARQGKLVVRLKGGDPGMFGRLAEEVEILDRLALPFRVIPGISSLSAATTGNGMLLTRRGVARGFSVFSARLAGSEHFQPVTETEIRTQPCVFFMGLADAPAIASSLIAEGRPETEPAAIICSAGAPEQKIIATNLQTLAAGKVEIDTSVPGLIVVGNIADEKYLYRSNGALEGKKILLTCSDALLRRAVPAVWDAGGVPLEFPLIRLVPEPGWLKNVQPLTKYDWIVLTSPSAVEIFMEQIKQAGIDLRQLPSFAVCGSGTAGAFAPYGIIPELVPEKNFGAAGLLEQLLDKVKPGQKLFRLRSELADSEITAKLLSVGIKVDDRVLYRSEPVCYDVKPSEFDAVLFTSPSTVRAFVENWTVNALDGKQVVAIGAPTVESLRQLGYSGTLIVPVEATVEQMIFALKNCLTAQRLMNLKG
ncbi:MAG: uroporphyrinogen-III C-methyltransferase [Victivallaceae bacterium]